MSTTTLVDPLTNLKFHIMELLDLEAQNANQPDASTLTETTLTAESETIETSSTIESGFRPASSIDELLDQLREIAAHPADEISVDDLGKIKQQFYYLKGEAAKTMAQQAVEGEDIAPEVVDDPRDELFKSLMSDIKEKRAQMRQQIEALRLANLERKNAIIEEINQMSGDTDNVNRHYPRVKELQNEFKAIGEVPQQNQTENWKSYQDAVEFFYDQWKVNKELRDYDFKKNLAEKQLLIDEAARLVDEPDVVVAFRRLQELHDKWREIGPVAKDVREEIWAKFKDESASVNKRYQAFFEDRKKREQENENAKTALCERIEAIEIAPLTSYATWNQATQQIIQAQEEWKTLGYASRKVNNDLFARFRKCCDDFFAAKSAFFQSLKDDLNANLEAKIALCEQAEALKDSTEWKKTSDKFVELQKKWKTIGAVPKKQSDAVWTRFLAACDYFFQQKKEATSSTRKTEQANLAVKRDIVAQLTALNTGEQPIERAEAIEKLHALRSQWQATGHVPFREKDKLHDQYREVVRQLFDKFDVHENRARQASFEASINEMASDKNKLGRERERLLRAYETRRAELVTYENNLSFLNAKSKTASTMLREIERNIDRLKKDIEQLQAKIDTIDSKF